MLDFGEASHGGGSCPVVSAASTLRHDTPRISPPSRKPSTRAGSSAFANDCSPGTQINCSGWHEFHFAAYESGPSWRCSWFVVAIVVIHSICVRDRQGRTDSRDGEGSMSGVGDRSHRGAKTERLELAPEAVVRHGEPEAASARRQRRVSAMSRHRFGPQLRSPETTGAGLRARGSSLRSRSSAVRQRNGHPYSRCESPCRDIRSSWLARWPRRSTSMRRS